MHIEKVSTQYLVWEMSNGDFSDEYLPKWSVLNNLKMAGNRYLLCDTLLRDLYKFLKLSLLLMCVLCPDNSNKIIGHNKNKLHTFF